MNFAHMDNLPMELIIVITEYLDKGGLANFRCVCRYVSAILDKVMWTHLELQPTAFKCVRPRLYYSCTDGQSKRIVIYFDPESIGMLFQLVRLSCFQHVKQITIGTMPINYLKAFFNIVNNLNSVRSISFHANNDREVQPFIHLFQPLLLTDPVSTLHAQLRNA